VGVVSCWGGGVNKERKKHPHGEKDREEEMNTNEKIKARTDQTPSPENNSRENAAIGIRSQKPGKLKKGVESPSGFGENAAMFGTGIGGGLVNNFRSQYVEKCARRAAGGQKKGDSKKPESEFGTMKLANWTEGTRRKKRGGAGKKRSDQS